MRGLRLQRDVTNFSGRLSLLVTQVDPESYQGQVPEAGLGVGALPLWVWGVDDRGTGV